MLGIYAIVNNLNRKVYIGSTVLSFSHRWGQHRSTLNRDCHPNAYLQEDWNEYGEDCFSFSVLQIVKDKGAVLGHEQEWLNKFLDSDKELYNIRVSATAPTPRQARSPRHILTDEEVATIRKIRCTEGISLYNLAKRYDVTESAISRICNNKRRTNPKKRQQIKATNKDGVKPKRSERARINITPSMKKRLKQIAGEQHRSLSQTAYALLREALGEEEQKSGNNLL